MTNNEEQMQVAVYQKAKKGNYYCGDSYYYAEIDDTFICAIADGLGSGEFARESSKIVMDMIRSYPNATVDTLVKACNKALFHKRGVVLGLLRVNFQAGTYAFSSIGNIGIMMISPTGAKKRNIPNAGFLAGYPRTFKTDNGVLEKGMNFIMFSDGVTDRELAKPFIQCRDVFKLTHAYANRYHDSQDDDTTLIAMNYQG